MALLQSTAILSPLLLKALVRIMITLSTFSWNSARTVIEVALTVV